MVSLIADTGDENPGLQIYRIVLAWACAHSGDLDGSRRLFDELRAGGFAVPSNVTWLAAQIYAADAASILADEAAAAVLYGRLLPYEKQVCSAGATVEGAVAHYLGCLAVVLDRPIDARRHLADALVLHESLEAPFHIARTLLATARLLEGDDPVASANARHRARRLAEEHGFEAIRTEALIGVSEEPVGD